MRPSTTARTQRPAINEGEHTDIDATGTCQKPSIVLPADLPAERADLPTSITSDPRWKRVWAKLLGLEPIGPSDTPAQTDKAA